MRTAGAAEYLVFDVPNGKIRWFDHREGRFVPLARRREGLYRSRGFPGLWLDEAAFLRGDGRALMAALRLGLESPEHAEFVRRLRAEPRKPALTVESRPIRMVVSPMEKERPERPTLGTRS